MSELAPAFRQQYFNTNGLPLAGGFLYTYVAGTTTPLATYTDETGVTPNTNPVVLDSSGSANIWIGNNAYKFVLEDSLNNVIETVDNILSIASQIEALSSTFQAVTVSYTQLKTAATSNAIALFSIPAGSILKNIVIKHSTSFTGGSITDVSVQVGIATNYTQFIDGFDIFQAVADQAFDNAMTAYIGSFANPTVIYLNATSTSANLNQLAQGSLTAFYEIEAL